MSIPPLSVSRVTQKTRILGHTLGFAVATPDGKVFTVQNTPIDISGLSAQDLVTLIAAANARLDQLRQEHIATGQMLGLTLVDRSPKKSRRAKNHNFT